MARDPFQFLTSHGVVATSCCEAILMTPRSKKWIMSAPWKVTRLFFLIFHLCGFDMHISTSIKLSRNHAFCCFLSSWQASVELTSPYTGKVVKVHHKVDVAGCTFDLYLFDVCSFS